MIREKPTTHKEDTSWPSPQSSVSRFLKEKPRRSWPRLSRVRRPFTATYRASCANTTCCPKTGGAGGGVYIFESRADAERVHDEVWRDRLRERMGVEPEVQYFDSPVIVDNEAKAASTA